VLSSGSLLESGTRQTDCLLLDSPPPARGAGCSAFCPLVLPSRNPGPHPCCGLLTFQSLPHIQTHLACCSTFLKSSPLGCLPYYSPLLGASLGGPSSVPLPTFLRFSPGCNNIPGTPFSHPWSPLSSYHQKNGSSLASCVQITAPG
jgi:hypothetical protein